MKRIVLTVTIVAATLLTACGSGVSNTAEPSAPSISPPASFGATLVMEGGGSVVVDRPQALQKTSTQRLASPGDALFKARIRYTNGPPGPLTNNVDSLSIILSASAHSGRQCRRVYDSAVPGEYQTPSTHLAPGQTLNWEFAYGCPASPGDDLIVNVSYGQAPVADLLYHFEGVLP